MSADDSHMSVTHSGAAAVVADVQVIYPPRPLPFKKFSCQLSVGTNGVTHSVTPVRTSGMFVSQLSTSLTLDWMKLEIQLV